MRRRAVPVEPRRDRPPATAPSGRRRRRRALRCRSVENGWNGLRLMSVRADRRVQEGQVERRVVTDEDGARASALAHGAADLAEQLRAAPPSRASPAAADDAGRCRSPPATPGRARAVKRLHVIAQRRAGAQRRPSASSRSCTAAISSNASVVAIEAAGLDVDHDRQETAEAVRDARLAGTQSFMRAYQPPARARCRRATARARAVAERIAVRHRPGLALAA